MGDDIEGSGAGREGECRLRDAKAALDALGDSYEVWAGEDLSDAKQALEAARAMPSGRQPQIQKVFDLTHNMKGLGGTFGYDLITLIGASLCDFIRDIPDATDPELRVISQHLAAMSIVLDKRIKGSGGSFGDRISAKLKHIIAASRE